MLITMQVTIGKAKVNLSDENIMSPGNLPNGSFFNNGYSRPMITIKDPNNIRNFCITTFHYTYTTKNQFLFNWHKYCNTKGIQEVFMADYWLKVFEFCKEQPGWAAAFFFCGFLIGETYFIL